jgi:hypothetical protein
MVPWGARKREGQNYVAIYMAFVLVFFRGMGTKSCWDQWAIEGVVYVAEGQVPTQIQVPMLWKIVEKQT